MNLEEQYKNFKNEELPKIIKAAKYRDNKIKIDFGETFTFSSYKDDIHTEDICVRVFIRDAKGDLETDMCILRVPVIKSNEVKIQDRWVQPVAGYRESLGPLLYEKEGVVYLDLKTAHSKPIGFWTDADSHNIMARVVKSKKETVKITAQSLIRVLLDSSADSIIQKLGLRPISDAAYENDLDALTKIYNVADNDRPAQMQKLRSQFLASTRFANTLEGVTRLCDFSEFSSCCVGSTLVAPIALPTGLLEGVNTLKAGTVLTQELCSVLDDCFVNDIRVNRDGIILHPIKFVHQKFNVLGDTLAYDLPELELKARTAIDEEILKKLNDSSLTRVSIIHNGKIVDVERFSDYSRNIPEVYLQYINLLSVYRHTDLVNRYELSNRSVDSFCKLVGEHVMSNLQAFTEAMTGQEVSMPLMNKFVKASQAIKPLSFYDWYVGDAAHKKLLHEPDVNNLYSYSSKIPRVFADVDTNTMTEQMVEVQGHQYGRLDALEISESTSTSKAHTMTLCSREVSGKGICTPYYIVRNGEKTDELVYLSANEEVGKNIANYNETFTTPTIDVLRDGDIVTVPKEDVNYVESSPYQNMSLTHAVIPFPGHSDCKRITMSCNEAKQSVPTVHTQRPYVNTGAESTVKAFITARDIVKNVESLYNVSLQDIHSIKLVSKYGNVRDSKLVFVMDGTEYAYNYVAAQKSSNGLLYGYKVLASQKGDGVYELDDYVLCHVDYCVDTKEDIVVYGKPGPEVTEKDFKHGVALVQNLNVVFKTFEHSTIDDACTISSKLVGDDTLTHVNLQKISWTCKSDDKGILPERGSYVKPGDIVFKDRQNNEAYTAKRTEFGHVIYTDVHRGRRHDGSFEATAILASRTHAHTGDKLAGRIGNKSVIAQIVPEWEMPYDPETGFVADIILNPQGVPTRQNISQLLEVPLSYLGYLTNTRYEIMPFADGDTEFVLSSVEDAGIKPKMFMDPRTGQFFDRPLNYGIISMQKLHHVVAGKLNFNNFGSPVNSNTNMPPKGIKSSGGQAIGEMELWAIASTGCNAILQELYGCRSDNPFAVSSMKSQLKNGISPDLNSGKPQNNQMLQTLMIQNCIKLENNPDGGITLGVLTNEDIRSLALIEVTDAAQLTSEASFGALKTKGDRQRGRSAWGYIPLNTSIVNPSFLNGDLDNTLKNLTGSKEGSIAKRLINCELFISDEGILNSDGTGRTGMSALVELLRKFKLDDLVLDYFPVIPLFYRQSSKDSTHPFDSYLKRIISANKQLETAVTPLNEKELALWIYTYLGVPSLRVDKWNRRYRNVHDIFQKVNHGTIRRQMYSKRVFSSLRSVIVPGDVNADEIGIPYKAAPMFAEMLEGRLRPDYPALADATPDLLKTIPDNEKDFNAIVKDRSLGVTMDEYLNIITPILEENVGIAGRQPTLHKYSIRGFHVKMTKIDAIEISPLVCTGYNADFDGDQMWFTPLYSEEAKREALTKLGSTCDIISPKDSAVTLQPSQDMILGLYLLTMFKDNTNSPSYSVEDCLAYSSLDKLRFDLEMKNIKHWQLVNYNGYVNTAGRIMFNSFVPDGFTGTMGLPSFTVQGLKECKVLKWDGLVCKSGSSGKLGDPLKRVSISNVCEDLYSTLGNDAYKYYDVLRRQGFFWCDNIGISISIWDYNDVCVESEYSSDIEKKLYEDYYAGLNSEEDLDAAMLSLYSGNSDNRKSVEDSILQKLQRNSNLFIILDSGAKGKFDQILQVSGYVGSLKKNSKGSIKTPIKHNYLKGLNSFESHQASRSTVINFAAAQKSTPDTGYSERKSVFMLSGMTITTDNDDNSEDCGKTDWTVPIRWGSLKNSYVLLSDSTVNLVTGLKVSTASEYYKLTGKTVIDQDVKQLVASGKLPFVQIESGEIIDFTLTFIDSLVGKRVDKESDYFTVTGRDVIGKDFYELYRDGHVKVLRFNGHVVDLSKIIELDYVPTDATSRLYLHNFDPDAPLDHDKIKLLQKYKIHKVETGAGEFVFTYNIHKSQRELLLGRVARNLPGLAKAKNADAEVTTEETLEYIEDNHVDSPEIRILLNCKNHKGVCRYCYGLDYGTHKLIEVGAEVGITSAMTIAEPTSQGVISLVNTGGSTVIQRQPISEMYKRLLSGRVYTKKNPPISPWHCAPIGGFAHIETFNNMSTVSIEGAEADYFSKVLPTSYVMFKDGEYVPKGALVFLEPASATTDMDDCMFMPEEVDTSLEKSLRWYTNYYVAYINSGVSIQQKHLELLARAQMNGVLEPRNEQETTLECSGIIPYITFERCVEETGNLISAQKYKDLTFQNTSNSQLSNIMTSSNIYTKENVNKNLVGRFEGRLVETAAERRKKASKSLEKVERVIVAKQSKTIDISNIFKDRVAAATISAPAPASAPIPKPAPVVEPTPVVPVPVTEPASVEPVTPQIDISNIFSDVVDDNEPNEDFGIHKPEPSEDTKSTEGNESADLLDISIGASNIFSDV